VRRLGKYEIVSELGRGGMGVVYKARDPFIDRLVALKTITSNLPGNSDLLQRFYQEARSAGTLQHPNIVTIYELGEENGAPFIAMEYIEGESLEAMIARKAAVPLAVKLGYIVRVSEGLTYAHEHGVIHRDIKPANIMVTAEGVVKIVDFGIARVRDAGLTQANFVIGSRGYIAPELYQGERADARSDVWALGATLYELLTYQRPFASETEAGLMFKILNEDSQPLRACCPDASEALEKIVARMLERTATARYQTVRDVSRDLGGIWRHAQEGTLQDLLGKGQELIDVRDFHGALEVLRQARQIDGSNLLAKSLFDQASKEARRQEVLPRVRVHLGQGRKHLQDGNLAAARAEVESALRLDSLHELAQQMLKEVEDCTKGAEQIGQLVRHAKQRFAEGALTQAQEILDEAAGLKGEQSAVQELRRQLAEEKGRRERRKELSEAQQRARALWTELKYAECLEALGEALKRFPGESTLLRLQETARQDWEEEKKQQQLQQARKLVGQQQFAQARSILDALAKQFPNDGGTAKLRGLVEQGEAEIKKQERLALELAQLRKLVNEERYAEAVAQGEALLREFQDEFELKELVGFARGELLQQRLRRQTQDSEGRIQSLLDSKQYAEAAAEAQRALREFGGHPRFQRLWEEADKKRKDQETRDEYQRRIREIQQRINRQELTDAIDLAQQTLTILGPDSQVSRLLEAARVERADKQKRGGEQALDAAQTMVEKGNFDEATRILNKGFATQIFQPSHPRAKDILTQIEKKSSSAPRHAVADVPLTNAAAAGAAASSSPSASSPFSATNVLSQTPPPIPHDSAPVGAQVSGSEQPSTSPAARGAATPVRRPSPATQPAKRPSSAPKADLSAYLVAVKQHLVPAGLFLKEKLFETSRALKPIFASAKLIPRRALIIGGLVAAALVGSITIGVYALRAYRESHLASLTEANLRREAEQLWSQHESDLSEDKWKQIEALNGALKSKATQQIASIEATRAAEKARFEEGNRLVQEDPSNPKGRQALQEVVEMHLWHAADAQKALDTVDKSSQAAHDLTAQEQSLFQEGEKSFIGGNYESARRRFRDLIALQVPNSALAPKAQEYLGKIRGLNDDKKNYDAAMEDLQNENWAAASDGFRAIIDRKGNLKDEAKKQLDKIGSAENAINAVSDLIRSRSYRAAKTKLDALQDVPKSSSRLRQALTSAEQQEFGSLSSRAQSLIQKQDVSGLQHLQDELLNFSGRAEDGAAVRSADELNQQLNKQVPQLEKEQSADNPAFTKAEKDFQDARSAGDITHLGSDVLHEFEDIARGSGYNRVAAQAYVTKVIPDAIRALTQNLSEKGMAVVPPIACPQDSKATLGKEQGVPCAKLDMDKPLQWIGNPTIGVPPGAKQAGKLPYVLHLIVGVDENGKVVHLDKDGAADQEFLKKAKDASKQWRTTKPLMNGQPVKTSFQVEVTFQP
jgi:eukaryotic-like serine/threonine-protein kinase